MFVLAEKKLAKKFIKVCPHCLSPNLSVRIFDMGSYYDCRECNSKEFYPWEFAEKDLKKAKEKLNKLKIKKSEAENK